MVAACMYPEPEKGGRGKKAPVTGEFLGINYKMLSEARTSRPKTKRLSVGFLASVSIIERL